MMTIKELKAKNVVYFESAKFFKDVASSYKIKDGYFHYKNRCGWAKRPIGKDGKLGLAEEV